MSPVDWPQWEPIYRNILGEFGFDRAADEAARDELDALLETRLAAGLEALRREVEGREAWVVGPAAPPEGMMLAPRGAPVFVTDGAAERALPLVRPSALVTDLDGHVGVQAAANALGVPLFVHAHGDNRDALRRHVPHLNGPVVGTTQAEPRGRVRNFGGFTDGDRAACLAAHLGASRLVLLGFDWGAPARKEGVDPEVKRRKLAWGRRIVEGLGVPVAYVAPGP